MDPIPLTFAEDRHEAIWGYERWLVSAHPSAQIDRALAASEKGGKTKRSYLKIILTVMSLAVLVITAALLFPTLSRLSKLGPLPVYDDAPYTAEDINELFAKDAAHGVSKAYTIEYVRSLKDLDGHLLPIPDNGKISVYEIKTPVEPETGSSFSEFNGEYLPLLCEMLGIQIPEAKTGEICVFYNLGNYTLGFFNNLNDEDNDRCQFHFNGEGGAVINGKTYSVNLAESDAAVAAALDGLRKELCETFGVSLPDVSVYRQLIDVRDSEGAVYDISSVIFYNAEQNGVDFNVCKCSDYITVMFYSHDDAIENGTVMNVTDVRYFHYGFAPEELCEYTADVDLIPLSDAEQMLYRGYIFGGHYCAQCMKGQPELDFTGYEKVGIVYYKGMPFYAFYKKIRSQSYGGVSTYARALVPAVKVSGLEEFFNRAEMLHVD